MQKIDFIADVLNPILDEDPMAVLVPIGGQALTHSDNTTQVMVSNTMVGGVDFLPTDSPRNIASKLLRVCLAELSAKGAVARNCALTLCLNETANNNWINSFGVGLVNELQEFGLSVVNCETRTTKNQNVVSMACIGELSGQPLSPAGAQPGDLVCLSGQVGLAALGRHIQAGADFGFLSHQNERFIDAFQRPNPNWALGSFLVDQARANASINISSGLMPDLIRLARYSNVGINVEFSAITFADNSLPIGQQLFASADHQLISCLSPANVELVKKWFPQVAIIGYVMAGEGVRLMDNNGTPIELDNLENDLF